MNRATPESVRDEIKVETLVLIDDAIAALSSVSFDPVAARADIGVWLDRLYRTRDEIARLGEAAA
jgi:hypothetical protein